MSRLGYEYELFRMPGTSGQPNSLLWDFRQGVPGQVSLTPGSVRARSDGPLEISLQQRPASRQLTIPDLVSLEVPNLPEHSPIDSGHGLDTTGPLP